MRKISLIHGLSVVIPFVYLFALACPKSTTAGAAEERPPNFLIFIADDQGYGDLGCGWNSSLAVPKTEVERASTA